MENIIKLKFEDIIFTIKEAFIVWYIQFELFMSVREHKLKGRLWKNEFYISNSEEDSWNKDMSGWFI